MNVYPQDNVAIGSMMHEEDLYNVIAVMLRREEDYRCHNYLEFDSSETNIDIDETCRTKMCEWIYQVVDCTRLQRVPELLAAQVLPPLGRRVRHVAR